MKNCDLILRDMMQTSLDLAKPRTNISRAIARVNSQAKTLESAFLVQQAVKSNKTKQLNEIFDRDTLVPDALKSKPPKLVSVKNLSEAGKVLAKQSKVVQAKKAA